MTSTTPKEANERATYLSIVMILLGAVLILLGQTILKDNIFGRLVDEVGVLVIGVFVISLLYEKFLAEKHYDAFSTQLRLELRRLDTVQAAAIRFGIKKIYDSRTIYEASHPLADLIRDAKEKSEILCVGRSLMLLLLKQSEIKMGLERGLTFSLACVDPKAADRLILDLTHIYDTDMGSTANALRDIANWAKNASPPPSGSLELRYHHLHLPDSGTYFDLKEHPLFVWDLSFGRDAKDKQVILLEPSDKNLGTNLLNRYQEIWKTSEPKFRLEGALITFDNMGIGTAPPKGTP